MKLMFAISGINRTESENKNDMYLHDAGADLWKDTTLKLTKTRKKRKGKSEVQWDMYGSVKRHGVEMRGEVSSTPYLSRLRLPARLAPPVVRKRNRDVFIQKQKKLSNNRRRTSVL